MIHQCKVLKWSINSGEGKWAFNISKGYWTIYLVTLESPFSYPLLYNPSFSTPWASFAHFCFGEKEESPRVRVYLWFSREERILFEFLRFYIPSKFVKWEKIFQVWKLKTSHLFLKHKAFFQQTSNLFFHRTPWDTLFHHGL